MRDCVHRSLHHEAEQGPKDKREHQPLQPDRFARTPDGQTESKAQPCEEPAANEGGNLFARIDPISLAGGISFVLLILLGGGFVAFKLAGARTARSVTPSAPQ